MTGQPPFDRQNTAILAPAHSIGAGQRWWARRIAVAILLATAFLAAVLLFVHSSLAGGLLFSALVGVGVLVLTGRTVAAENLVATRTRELAETNERLARVIDEHLKTERLLETERGFLGAVLENLGEGVVACNAQGELMYLNRAARQLHGLPWNAEPKEDWSRRYSLYQADGQELIAPENLPLFRAFRGERVRGAEMVVKRQDDSRITLAVTAEPIVTMEGELHGAVAVFSDITERKHFEQALGAKNVELENANTAKDRFLASMSHELRTPLTSVIGFTGTLLMKLAGPLNEVQIRQLEIVKRSSNHLLSLINDLLDLAKIESGNIELSRELVSCQGAIEDVHAALQPLAERKGLTLTVEQPQETVLAYTDRRALNQILINLTNNAIKFTERGGIVIRLLHDGAGAAGKSPVRINVCDTGMGITAEGQERLFLAFSRTRVEANRHVEGTGLGLYLCRKLIDLLQGEIRVSSESGGGSTFSVFLPDAAAAQGHAHAPALVDRHEQTLHDSGEALSAAGNSQ